MSIVQKFKTWFAKEDTEMGLPQNEVAAFHLTLKDLDVGTLTCEDGIWKFQYTAAFKNVSDIYYPIVGFPDTDQVYQSASLWPFFLIRIPGLKQPAIREITERENININNEVALLKKFGRKTISNPYELVCYSA